MHKTLGSYTVSALAAYGVRHVFGIPGVHNLELYRGLPGSGIRHIAGRHEQGLGFMADGYARVSGGVGVCLTITGPGLTNIATAMGQAYADSIPLLIISSETATTDLGRGRGCLHEMSDQLGIAARLSGTAQRVGSPEELPTALARAFDCMTSARPRPAYIGIPRDVLAASAEGLPVPQISSPAARPQAPSEQIAAAASLLAAADAPLILAGGGALGAADELRNLAEAVGAPLVMTINGRGLLPPDHPLAVSLSPSLRIVRALIASSDVVLAVGTELGPTDYNIFVVADFPQPPNLIRIDIDAAQLERNAHARLGLCGDAAPTLQAILRHDLATSATRVARGKARAAETRDKVLAAMPSATLGQLALVEMIRDRVPRAIFVGDSTQPVYTGNSLFAAASPGSWFNSATGFGTLGYALPASSGASLAAPDRPVVCLIGDGGIQFSLGELGVPRDIDAWMAIVVWNNAGYGEIKFSMEEVGIAAAGVDIRPPDFNLLARAYGYEYQLIESCETLDRALCAFASRRQVVLLEVSAQGFE